ncbi:MAG TPA: hypothetical protein VNG12_01510 [Acidimicrobiales bacterium]|nr:hypothetical protein [Acidimicrobiales bacterium]
MSPHSSIDGILEQTRSILLVDWPSRAGPDTLTRAGFAVTVHGGPGPCDYSNYTVVEGNIVAP